MKLRTRCMMLWILLPVILNGCGIQAASSSFSSSENEPEQPSFEYQVREGIVEITKCNVWKSICIIPEQIDGYGVGMIGKEAFYQHDEIIDITLPESLLAIGEGAFYRCRSLEKLKIPAKVERIGIGAFFRCSSLQSIDVSDNNSYYTDIEGVLFNKDTSELIAYPEGNSAKCYTIPSTVVKIGEDAFGYRCGNLMEIVIPSSVVEFPDYNLFATQENLLIIADKGSAAERYARQFELNLVYRQ